jgi:hypothetical protein
LISEKSDLIERRLQYQARYLKSDLDIWNWNWLFCLKQNSWEIMILWFLVEIV